MKVDLEECQLYLVMNPLFEVWIDYENKVAIYDDYCGDMYAIKNNENHEICHHDFSFQLNYASHDSYFVKFTPTIIHE